MKTHKMPNHFQEGIFQTCGLENPQNNGWHGEMKTNIPGHHTILGSDVKRDGMYLELIEDETDDEVAEIFYSDQTGKMTVSVFKSTMPIEVVDLFLAEAKERLLPETKPE